MKGRWSIVVAAVLVMAAGCKTEAPAPPKGDGGEEAGPVHIRAVQPENRVQRVSRRLVFRWKLPKRLQEAAHVTFLLAEAGTGEEPVTDEAQQRRIATATGLDTAAAGAFDPWDPPGGCVLTGEVRDISQLAPETWYRWTVRAVGAGMGEHADFYFRTRDTSAVPEQ